MSDIEITKQAHQVQPTKLNVLHSPIEPRKKRKIEHNQSEQRRVIPRPAPIAKRKVVPLVSSPEPHDKIKILCTKICQKKDLRYTELLQTLIDATEIYLHELPKLEPQYTRGIFKTNPCLTDIELQAIEDIRHLIALLYNKFKEKNILITMLKNMWGPEVDGNSARKTLIQIQKAEQPPRPLSPVLLDRLKERIKENARCKSNSLQPHHQGPQSHKEKSTLGL